MDWTGLFLGVAVLAGFWVVKIIAELVWEGLKTRLRRELGSDSAPVPAGGGDVSEQPAASSNGRKE